MEMEMYHIIILKLYIILLDLLLYLHLVILLIRGIQDIPHLIIILHHHHQSEQGKEVSLNLTLLHYLNHHLMFLIVGIIHIV